MGRVIVGAEWYSSLGDGRIGVGSLVVDQDEGGQCCGGSVVVWWWGGAM